MSTLTEHRKSEPLRFTLEQQAKLKELFHAEITPAENGLVRVTPGSRAGAVVLDGDHVVVEPKVPLPRIVHMLTVAVCPLDWRTAEVKGLQAVSIEDAVVQLFARSCQQAFAAGVYRSYRTEEQRLAFVRGRIRIGEYLRDPRPLPVPVTATVHDEDVAENQVLAAAVQKIRLLPGLPDGTRAELARVWQVVGEVTPLAGDVALDECRRIVWSRHNSHYQAPVRLAELILDSSSLKVTAGKVQVPGFILDMPRIVEQYVRVLVRDALGASEHDMRDSWRGALWLDEGRRVQLIPDLGMRRAGRWRFVGDVKYKVNAGPSDQTGAGRREDLYQLLAYVTETGLEEGTLIYAGDRAGEVEHTVRGTGERLRVISVNLGAEDCDRQVMSAVLAGRQRPPSC
ncbi:McrC family protein [Corynebacterium variabile]|uniref:McrC family protein n=1 Tax=Corynebacterium variabile TaxID=1727 RepID=UPI003FCF1B54